MMRRFVGIVVLATVVALPVAASANVFDSVNKGMSAVSQAQAAAQSTTSGSSLLQQLGSGSFKLGSAQNVAGVLGYCQKQGYAPSAVETAKGQLMSKLGMASNAQQSPAYKDGLAGILNDSVGKGFDLSTLKTAVGKRVCKAVADKAVSSFLGG